MISFVSLFSLPSSACPGGPLRGQLRGEQCVGPATWRHAPGEFAAMMREQQLAIKAREAREQRRLQAAVAAAQRHGRRSGPPLPMEEDEFDIRPYELSAPQSLQELDTWEASPLGHSFACAVAVALSSGASSIGVAQAEGFVTGLVGSRLRQNPESPRPRMPRRSSHWTSSGR